MVGGYISSKEFEEIAEIYDQIRQWNQDCQQAPVEDQTLAAQFDQELKIVMKNISSMQPSSPEEGAGQHIQNLTELSRQ